MRTQSTMLAVAALLVCSACAEQSATKMSLAGDANVQVSSVRWDEIANPTQSAKVINGSLIFMR